MNDVYQNKVGLLIRLMPYVMNEGVFAVHGGSAINLFVKDMPRYSVDIDLTYMPLAGREESLNDINNHLLHIAEEAKKGIPGLHIVPKLATCKLLCEYHGFQIKVEVNQTKRGIVGGNILTLPLCNNAKTEFRLSCKAQIVPLTLLYGGKIAAALSRQHPRDLFDVKYMDMPLSEVREGLIFCLLGSDRPIHESFAPTLIDQRDTMSNQFDGMTDFQFSYEDFEQTRAKLIADVRSLMTDADKQFLLSFEAVEPLWENYEFEYFQNYPSVQWKLLNLAKLKKQNPAKLYAEVEKLQEIFG